MNIDLQTGQAVLDYLSQNWVTFGIIYVISNVVPITKIAKWIVMLIRKLPKPVADILLVFLDKLAKALDKEIEDAPAIDLKKK